jgi:hypothetical protein
MDPGPESGFQEFQSHSDTQFFPVLALTYFYINLFSLFKQNSNQSSKLFSTRGYYLYYLRTKLIGLNLKMYVDEVQSCGFMLKSEVLSSLYYPLLQVFNT